MRLLKQYLFIFIIAAGYTAAAQNPYLKEADRLFDNYVYQEASVIYLSYLQQQYDYNANYKLAECYRMMNDPINAEYWYAVLMEQPVQDPLLYLNYAETLRTNGKYSTAKENYLKYAVYDDDGYYLAGMCDWAITNSHDRSAFLIDTLGINTPSSEFGAAFFKKGFIFSSNAATGSGETYTWTGTPYYDLYYAETASDGRMKRTLLEGDANSKAHDASPCYSSTVRALYFTRNNYYKNRSKQGKDGEVKLELFISYYAEGGFMPARPLSINNRSYSSGQPAISPDGTILVFTSDRPGGFGGTDLFYSTKTDGVWSMPKNLGDGINTPGNEMFPYISDDGKLYFSSNWHLGYGGLDVFVSTRENGHWSKPHNLGMPVNSSYDDFSLVIRSGKGYVSSNRPGGKGGDDIYSVTELNPVKGIFVHDPDLKAISGAKVTYTEGPQTQVICVTDTYGYCDLSAFVGKNIAIKIAREGYLETMIKNLNTIKTNNGVYPVELQPLIGSVESSPKHEIALPGKETAHGGGSNE